MKKSILFIVFVLSFASIFVTSCQKKEGGFSKSDLLGTWYFMGVANYTFNGDGTGDCLEPIDRFNLKWDVQNDSLLVGFYEGGELKEFKRWTYAIDSLVNGEHHGKKIRTLYLSDAKQEHLKTLELKQEVE